MSRDAGPVPAWIEPAALSFVAAWADTVGFVALFGLFTAHVTGNFVIIGAALASATDSHGGILAKVLALPVFALAVCAMTVVVRRRDRAGRSSARLVVIVEATMLTASFASGWIALPTTDADAPWVLVASAFAVIAMGVQNAAGRLVFTRFSPTTVMTVNVAQISVDLVDLASDPRAKTKVGRDARDRAVRLAPPIAAFLVGAIVAALTYRAFGYACLIVPIVVLVALVRIVPAADRPGVNA